jgi:hypothetical protein
MIGLIISNLIFANLLAFDHPPSSLLSGNASLTSPSGAYVVYVVYVEIRAPLLLLG